MRFGSNTYNVFLALLRRSLWQEEDIKGKFPLTSAQWDEIYRMSWVQAVTGLLYDAIEGLPKNSGLNSAQIARWMSSARFIEENNAMMNAAINNMALEWKAHGITAIVQKGRNVARMYPRPEHRVSGDIDWYFPSRNDWEKALALVQSYKPETDSDGDIHYTRNGIVVEHHRHGSDPDDPVSVLIMINEHILHHAMVMGIGYRHFCDMALGYRYYKGKYDPEELRTKLRKMHLLRWTHLLNTFLIEVMGMPEEYLPFPVKGRHGTAVLEFLVINDGNLGLEKDHRMDGLNMRSKLFLHYAPVRFLSRWVGLAFGRLLRIVKNKE